MTSENYQLEKARTFALLAAIAGGVGSLVLFSLARQNPPLLIVAGFVFWILAPWAALLWANIASKRWKVPTRVALYVTTFVITIASLAIYLNDVISPPSGPRAFWWVTVSPVSLFVAIIVIGAVALINRSKTRDTASRS